MRLGKQENEEKKTNPYEVANKGIVWLRNGVAAAGATLVAVKALPVLLKDIVKK